MYGFDAVDYAGHVHVFARDVPRHHRHRNGEEATTDVAGILGETLEQRADQMDVGVDESGQHRLA
jgi:hypothetical protein